MVTKRRLLALFLIGTCVVFAACSLITDVDRSKIEGAGGAIADASSTDTGGHSGTGGSVGVDSGDEEPGDAAVTDAGTK
jgi:hypothetical protein